MGDWVIPAFVVLSIVLLLVIPIRVAERNEDLRMRMDTIVDPAGELVTDVQYNLARDMGALRGYLLTGDTLFLTRRADIVTQVARAIDALGGIVPVLGEPAVTSFVELRVRVDRWHRLSEAAGAAENGEAQTVRDAAVEQRQYQAALEAAARMDAAVAEAARVLREEIRGQERRALRYTFLLAFLALASLVGLIWLGTRLRRLAAEAERQRQESQDALAETRRAGEARRRLIRGVTHDVKNPLGAADGYAELLELGLRGPLEPPQRETVGSIRRSITTAVHTINDLLALSQAEDERLGLQLEELRLSLLVREAVYQHRGVAEAAGRLLVVEETGFDPVIRTDRRRVEQVLGNLLSNAIKHSAPGQSVRVAVVEEPGATPGSVGIQVADTGPGIRPEDLERIFDEFERLDTTRPGHGLGLTISRTIARRLGGELTVSSRPGAGATFTFSLPGADASTAGSTREEGEADGASANR